MAIAWGSAKVELERLCALYGRPILTWTDVPGGGSSVPVFVPPLTTAEQAILDDLMIMARFGVSLTLAEWRAIKQDAADLRTYLGRISPTAAQTAAATKAIIRTLGTIIRS